MYRNDNNERGGGKKKEKRKSPNPTYPDRRKEEM